MTTQTKAVHGGVLAGPIQSLSRALCYDRTAPRWRYDGLSAFAPLWGMAMLFSLAADPRSLSGQYGPTMFILNWAGALSAILLMVRPRATWLLAALALSSVALYVYKLPVASNNKTIATFMNGSVLLVLAVLLIQGKRGEDLRETAYERLRVIARGLLAVMYIFGIYHKINTDFLDPAVSCAVGLYKPLATPFGLGDSLAGKYMAIYSTFVIETITLVGLYWRRWFAVGFITALIFHYIIPISAFSWYMDFSSLVLALYALSIPAVVSGKVYNDAVKVLAPIRHRLGNLGILVPGVMAGLLAAGVVVAVSLQQPAREPMLLYHSVWVVLWAVIGGVAVVAFTRAAIEHMPFTGARYPRQPLWLWLIPGAMFLMCLSPYVGLKTESSVNMFSNLHTEGGVSNHLVTPKPPYLFNYQNDLARIIDSNNPKVKHLGETDQYMVMLGMKELLRKQPDTWITYEKDGVIHERATTQSFIGQQAGLLERNLLIFKSVDFSTPKACTH